MVRGAFVAIDVCHFPDLDNSLRDNPPQPPYQFILFEIESSNSLRGRFSCREADAAQDNDDELLRVRDGEWDSSTMRLCGPLTVAVGDTVYAPSFEKDAAAHTSALYAAEVVEKPQKKKNKTYVRVVHLFILNVILRSPILLTYLAFSHRAQDCARQVSGQRRKPIR